MVSATSLNRWLRAFLGVTILIIVMMVSATSLNR